VSDAKFDQVWKVLAMHANRLSALEAQFARESLEDSEAWASYRHDKTILTERVRALEAKFAGTTATLPEPAQPRPVSEKVPTISDNASPAAPFKVGDVVTAGILGMKPTVLGYDGRRLWLKFEDGSEGWHNASGYALVYRPDVPPTPSTSDLLKAALDERDQARRERDEWQKRCNENAALLDRAHLDRDSWRFTAENLVKKLASAKEALS